VTLDRTGGAPPRFLVRFRGVRGSHPVSRHGAESVGGHTSCIEILAGRRRLIFDLGTGIIPLGDELVKAGDPVESLVLVSHVHHDHTMGFPFFKPVYDPRSKLVLAGPRQGETTFRDLLETTFSHPYFPVEPADMRSQRTFHSIDDAAVLTWAGPGRDLEEAPDEAGPDDLVLRSFHALRHPNGGVLCFRMELGGVSVVLATDVEGTEGVSGDLVDFSAGADLLIHDAQYTDEEYETKTKGWGHSTWRMAADVAARAGVGCLALYHHDPAHDDREIETMERGARGHFPQCIAAAEGLEILL
jgi:phosphoribosyl 1,2-cyclic phosphodiesterase